MHSLFEAMPFVQAHKREATGRNRNVVLVEAVGPVHFMQNEQQATGRTIGKRLLLCTQNKHQKEFVLWDVLQKHVSSKCLCKTLRSVM